MGHSITVARSKLSGWKTLKREWEHCTRCPLSATRSNVCLLRGSIPADVLFIGEAPGESEDVLGLPFVGPAGKLLTSLIDQAFYDSGDYDCTHAQPSYAITNIIACAPRHDPVEDYPGEIAYTIGKPSPKEIKACRPRLVSTIQLLNPKAIVQVGSISKGNMPPISQSIRVFHIVHPAYILRKPEGSGLDYKRSLLTLKEVYGYLQSL